MMSNFLKMFTQRFMSEQIEWKAIFQIKGNTFHETFLGSSFIPVRSCYLQTLRKQKKLLVSQLISEDIILRNNCPFANRIYYKSLIC